METQFAFIISGIFTFFIPDILGLYFFIVDSFFSLAYF